MAIFSHRGDHAVVFFSEALSAQSAVDLVDTVDSVVALYFYSTVELVVTSDGGTIAAFECVLDAMRRWTSAGVHVRIRVVASAVSAAALLVALGAERVAAPGARLRFHHVRALDAGSVSAAEARALHGALSDVDSHMAALLAERALQCPLDAPAPSAGAKASDRAVLEHLARGGGGARRARAGRHSVRALAARVGRRVERAVRRRDRAALTHLYRRLAQVDAPISAPLALTLRLVDRVEADGHDGAREDAAPADALVVPQWRALYPPNGAVPVEALVRHTLVLGETGSGKSASAVLPVLGAVARAPKERFGAALVIDPKRELQPALEALAPERVQRIVASETALNLMSGQRWSLDAELAAGRYLSAATRVLRRVLSLVPDIPARVLEQRSGARDPYWELEGTELLVTVVAFLLILLRPDAPERAAYDMAPREARDWVDAFYQRAHGAPGAAQRGANLVALAAWALRSALMGRCSQSFPDSVGAARVAYAGTMVDTDSGTSWCFAHLAHAVLAHDDLLWGEGRDVLERVTTYWAPLAGVRSTFAGVLGSAVASTSAFAAPAVAHSLYFGVEPGWAQASSTSARVDFAREVSREGTGPLFVFQPARDQRDNLVAVALKAHYFEAVLADPDRARGCRDMPIVAYVADEFQRYVTSDLVHGEQSFFDTCRSYRAACVVACQSVASLAHALSLGGGDARRDEAALGMVWTNTATKLVFRTTDPETLRRLEDLCPQRRGFTDVVRARPPSVLAVGECYAALSDGRFERRQLEAHVLDCAKREARLERRRARRRSSGRGARRRAAGPCGAIDRERPVRKTSRRAL